MSNRVVIEPTQFINTRTGLKTFGVRVYDDYTEGYINLWDEVPDDDMDVLRKTINEKSSEIINETLDWVENSESGIFIGSNWYDWDEIKDYFS